ncbi:multidrug ABC transporter ATP-binding protein, partial [Clostridium perfringens]|nr:multidrug ABC transporter ATP-binding protein [Clostridium perfringens]
NRSGLSQYEQDKQAKREARARQRRAEQLEQQIAEYEQILEEQAALLTQPDVYNDYLRVQEIQQQVDSVRTKLETAYAEWETCME